MLNVNKYDFNTYQTAARCRGVTKPAINRNALSICYVNDLHGSTDKIAGVMESFKNFDKIRQGRAILKLSGGDNVSGGDLSKNELMLDIMQNAMGTDVSGAGNHEFDAGIEGLIKFAKDKKMSFVATNVEFDGDYEGIEDVVKRSVVIEENGVKYGFVGAMPLDFATCTKKSAQKGVEVMDFEDSIEAIQEEIDKLKEQKINRIILMSHSGFENDQKYAPLLKDVDIIISGHSHTAINGVTEGVNLLKSKSGEPVIIVQAGENGKYYGILDVEFDDYGRMIKIANQLIPISSKKSPTVEYVKEQKMGLSPTIGTIKQVDDMPPNRRIKPHSWANLIVDSMASELNTDLAFLNAANVRKVPTEGKLTERDVTESVPMKNKLIKTRVTQKQVVEAISQAAKETFGCSTGEPGLLYASGLRYKIDESGNLLELNFVDKKGKITPIDINNPSEKITYSAVYDEFTMRADGEYPALSPKFAVEHFEFDKDKTAIDYISKMPNKDKLIISNDNRLEIVQTSKMPQQGNNNQRFLSLTAPKVS